MSGTSDTWSDNEPLIQDRARRHVLGVVHDCPRAAGGSGRSQACLVDELVPEVWSVPQKSPVSAARW